MFHRTIFSQSVWICYFAISASVAQAQNNLCAHSDANQLQDLLEKWAYAAQVQTPTLTLAATIKNCVDEIKNPNQKKCFENLKNYTDAVSKRSQPGHDGGYEISDLEYAQKVFTRAARPIDLPKEFKKGLPSNWKEIAEKNSWKYIEYISRSIPNPPNNDQSRVLILRESPEFDQWLQFTISDAGESFKNDGHAEGLVNVIGVEKKEKSSDGTTVDLLNPKISFAEYEPSHAKRPSLHFPSYSCYSCHGSGMRQIHPVPGSVAADQLAQLKELNKKMDSYSEMDLQYIKPASLGPHQGQGKSCVECHNNFTDFQSSPRGALNITTAAAVMSWKMTQEFSMPPGLKQKEENKKFFQVLSKANELSPADRKELLDSQYYKDLPNQNTYILNFLLRKKIITKAEYTEAQLILQRLTATQKQEYDDIQKDYARILSLWLKGDAEKCAK